MVCHKIINQKYLFNIKLRNGGGYDIAKKLNTKFSYISPVWYQIHPTIFELKGGHDVDQVNNLVFYDKLYLNMRKKGWIAHVRYCENPPKILPRILFERWSEKEFSSIGTTPGLMDKIVTIIENEAL